MPRPRTLTRRQFTRGLAASGLAAGLPALAASASPGRSAAALRVNPRRVALEIGRGGVVLDGRSGEGTLIDGGLPGPVLRFTEGDEIEIAVSNRLAEDTSIHWHGILLPSDMDGVPGLSFAGIAPGETFTYRYRLRQSGTYWYHSHSGLQEQSGLYGALIVDPREAAPPAWDREHVVLLSDWTFEDPHAVLATLKKQSHYYNRRQPVLSDLFDADDAGAMLRERTMWAAMRMDMSDIADVTGTTYDYLLNGHTPAMNFTALYAPGERVLLRLVNASAMTLFDFRVAGLPLTVVAADGQPVSPVETDELRIGVAETYDVVVTPPADGAFALFAESMDRSGFACGTLASAAGAVATPPARRAKPMRDMRDMSMPGHARHGAAGAAMDGGEHAHHHHHADDPAPRWQHGPDHHGPGAAMVNEFPRNRLDEPGVGLDDAPHRVLRYSQLVAPAPWPDRRAPGREIELHLTGHMERYMWSFDGLRFSEVDGPIVFHHGERLRLTLVNDTMMEHPIHLHGMWMELDNGNGARNPRKHTIVVKPNERLSALITADAPGPWAFHCHLLYHMHMGMMRVVQVA